jgi:hypothetical protein
MGYNFWFHSSIELNVLHELPDAVVVVVLPESLVVEEYGLPRQTETTAKKGYNYSSIELNVLHELPKAVVVVVPAEFLFGEEYGLPR